MVYGNRCRTCFEQRREHIFVDEFHAFCKEMGNFTHTISYNIRCRHLITIDYSL